jgi:hypothetical protein
MKIVLNVDYGGIGETSAAKRLDPKFIEDVETGRFVGDVHEKWGFAETLKVFEIPDEAIDYRIVNYDGCEGIVYCSYGKLYFVGSDECRRIFEDQF